MSEFENKVFATKKEGRRFMDDYLKKVVFDFLKSQLNFHVFRWPLSGRHIRGLTRWR